MKGPAAHYFTRYRPRSLILGTIEPTTFCFWPTALTCMLPKTIKPVHNYVTTKQSDRLEPSRDRFWNDCTDYLCHWVDNEDAKISSVHLKYKVYDRINLKCMITIRNRSVFNFSNIEAYLLTQIQRILCRSLNFLTRIWFVLSVIN